VKFHEVALFTDEVCIVTERVTPLQLVIDSLLPIEICSGLHNIIEALAFLHSAVLLLLLVVAEVVVKKFCCNSLTYPGLWLLIIITINTTDYKAP